VNGDYVLPGERIIPAHQDTQPVLLWQADPLILIMVIVRKNQGNIYKSTFQLLHKVGGISAGNGKTDVRILCVDFPCSFRDVVE
jgi:hypothetical protein